MKRTISILVFFAVCSAATAQVKREIQHQQGNTEKPMRQGMKPNRHNMLKELGLTEAQKLQLKTNHEAYQKKLEQLEENQGMTLKEYNEKKDALIRERNEKMQALLTPEQKAKMSGIKERQEKQGAEMSNKRLEKMKTELSLNEDQVIKLKAADEATRMKIKAIRENEALGSYEKKKQLKAAMQEAKEQRKKILTEDQLKKLEEMKMHKKRQQATAI